MNKFDGEFCMIEMDAWTGMVVVVDEENGTVRFPSEVMVSNFSFLDKERVPTGLNTARGDMSDYEEDFNLIVHGERVKVVNFLPETDVFGTDQFDPTVQVENWLVATTNGKLRAKFPEEEIKPIYQCVGFYDDNGHTLCMVKKREGYLVK